MINIDGKCYFKMDITGFPDIIDDTVFFELRIKESAGNVLPIATFKYNLPPQLTNYIVNEGVDINITLGASQDSAIETQWKMLSWEINKSTLDAILRLKPEYLNDRIIKVINSSSVNAIKEVAEDYFELYENFNTETGSFSDIMKWISYNIHPRDFINEVWIHSYSDGKLLIPAILMDGKFRLKNVMDKSKFYNIAKDNSDEVDFIINNQYTWSSNSGAYNNIIGEVKTNEYNLDDGDPLREVVEPTPIFGELFNRSTFSENQLRTGVISSNVHDDFFKAVSHNLGQLAQFGGWAKKFDIVDLFGLRILDHVNLVMPEYGYTEASEIQSGLCLVTDTETIIDNNNFRKEVIIRKDAVTVQSIQGTFI